MTPCSRRIDSRDPDVRKFIVDILGDIRDPRSVPALINKLTDPDENIRVASAEALGKIRDRRAVEPLLACLAHYDQSWLDYAAAEALGEIGDERALGPLIAALGRSSLREPVLESLGKIGNIEYPCSSDRGPCRSAQDRAGGSADRPRRHLQKKRFRGPGADGPDGADTA